MFLSVVFFLLSFYLLSKFLFHLFLILSVVPDENSMEDPLCNSAIGSMVSLDYVTPDTQWKFSRYQSTYVIPLNILPLKGC